MIYYYGGESLYNVADIAVNTLGIDTTLITLDKKSITRKAKELIGGYMSTPVYSVNSLSAVPTTLNNTKPILDTETTGLDPRKDKVIMLQFGNLEHQVVIDTRHYDIRLLKKELESIRWSGTNLKYDYNMLKQYGIVLNILEDTSINDMIIDAGTTGDKGKTDFTELTTFGYFTMAGSYYRYFDESLDKDTTMLFLTIGQKPFTVRHIVYAVQDIVAPSRILVKQERLLRENGYRNTFKLDDCDYDLPTMEAEVSFGLGDMEYNGMPIVVESWLKLGSVFKTKILKTRQKLDDIAIKEKIVSTDKYGLFGNTTTNWNSPKQLIELLSRINGADLKDYGKKKIGTSKAILTQNIPVHEIFSILLKYREYKKAISTYGVKFVNKFVVNGRVHASYWQILTTGRTSSSKPNIQNIPHDEEVRSCFRVAKGYKMINCDYSGQESVVTANKCKDSKLIDFYLNGDGDLHSFVANILFEILEGVPQNISKKTPSYSVEFDKDKRDLSKTVNFKLDYGGSIKTIATSFSITEEKATELYNGVLAVFPEKVAYFSQVAKDSIKQGYILINEVTHRKRMLPNYDKFLEYYKKVIESIGREKMARLLKSLLENKQLNTKYWKGNKKTLYALIRLYSSYKRLSMNTPTQGTAGDMTKIAILLLRKRLIAKGYTPLHTDVKLLAEIHDEILSSCKEEDAEWLALDVKSAMEDAGALFCEIVPMKAEPVIQDTWGH